MKEKLVNSIRNQSKLFVIAGPCSAESREQMGQIAQSLSRNSTVNLFRAGIWKPRTHPDSFEGLGEKHFLGSLRQVKNMAYRPVLRLPINLMSRRPLRLV